MRILIAGCGDLGTELGLRLAADGHQVIGLRRSPDRLPGDIEPLAGDLTGDLPTLPADTEVVVHAAAASAWDPEVYREVYDLGLDRLLDGLAAVDAPLRRVVFVSSTAVYGGNEGAWVDEDTPIAPASPTGAVLADAERRLWRRTGELGVSVRLAGIYGPGRTRMIDQVRDGTAVIPEPSVHTNWIHRDDAAAALAHLLTEVAEPASCYLGVDHDPADRGEVVRFLADELQVPHPPVGRLEPGDRTLTSDKRCRNDRLVATGFSFTYPTYREGFRAVMAGRGTYHG